MPDALALLAQFVAETKGPITRQKIMTERKRITAARKAHLTGSAPIGLPPAADVATSSTEHPVSDLVAKSTAVFDVVLIDLRNRTDVKRIDTDYVRGGEPAALKIGDRLSHAALVVVIFRLGDVCALVKKLEFWRKAVIEVVRSADYAAFKPPRELRLSLVRNVAFEQHQLKWPRSPN